VVHARVAALREGAGVRRMAVIIATAKLFVLRDWRFVWVRWRGA
jgi:hypothetical protein